MERETMLKLYNRLTGLVEKLPGGLQKPVLQELVPIRETFLESRAARIMLVGNDERPLPDFLRTLGMAGVVPGGIVDNGWRAYEDRRLGSIEVLDARRGLRPAEAAFARSRPDVIVWVQGGEAATSAELADAAAALANCPHEIPLVAWADGEFPAARAAAAISAEKALSSRGGPVFHDREIFAEEVCGLLPNAARLYFARLAAARKAQARLAGSLLKSFTAVCGVIGLQPIPLADLPILTTLQTLMVALIIQTTGRRLTPALVAEFFGALGLNIGAGLLFREGARALIKILPFWGHAVSGLVAGAGTYAIGRAAVAYFIEGLPVEETRRLFRRLKPGRNSFGEKPAPTPPDADGDAGN